MKNADITDPLFREAVQAIDTGNIEILNQLLEQHPELVTHRLSTPLEEGYFKDPYLLWFVADNPIRHEKLPPNITDVTAAILKALQGRQDASYQFQVDYTLGLVSTGRIPKECSVQIPLMELLIKEGANVKGSVLGTIGHGNMEAATYLLEKGATYNLATAVGLGKNDDIPAFIKSATASELFVSLVVASFFGRAGMISLLIDAGVDVNGKGTAEDFAGFHSHATALHQAVYSGSLESVKLLVTAGADLTAMDKAFSGTPLGWAMYMQTEEYGEAKKANFAAIEAYLKNLQV